jgi:PAS domain S-box-containing protein
MFTLRTVWLSLVASLIAAEVPLIAATGFGGSFGSSFPVIVRASISASTTGAVATAAGWLPDLAFLRRYLPYLGFILPSAAQAVLIGFLIVGRFKQRKLEAEHERAFGALRESEAKNAAILSAFPDLMFLMDDDGTYLDWYARDKRNLYVPPEQFLGKKMREIMPPDLAEIFSAKLAEVKSSGEPATVEYSLLIQGQTKFFETRLSRCDNGNFLAIVRDLTEKKQAEQELQLLSSRLLALQDDERRRIARELHDMTAQNLFAININLETLRQRTEGLTSAGMEIFRECRSLCERSLREVCTLSYALHPPALDRLGLIPSLRSYIDSFVRRDGMEVSLEATHDIGRLPLEMETDIFRIVQEGLSNVICHSGSKTASVQIKRVTDQIVLQIRDNGRGLPDRPVDCDNGARFGVGLPSMRERLRRWSGHLHIRSEEDGVLLLIQVPIPTGNHKHEQTVAGSEQTPVG